MEPEMRAFFIRIVNTMLIIIVWMILNATIGIMLQWGFIYDRISLGNIIFYLWLIASLLFSIWKIKNIWKEPLDLS
ncbi:MAG: hypothetical protein JSS67_07205 [Bacteroidetes bacterium]|nr:hypothetical protein [Bacteroidota bacterium]